MSVTKISGHTCSEIKSTAASWNVTLSCLFSSLPCTCILCHFKQEIFPLIDLSLVSIIQTNLPLQGLDSEYATHADWVTETNLSLAILAYTTWYGHCHLVCRGQGERCPKAWNLRQYCFILLQNTDTNMLCRLFDDRKCMDIYLPIHQEYCYLGKQKISLYFSTSTCEHLWPSPSHFVNCPKCSHNRSKDVADRSVWNIF